LCNGFDEEGKWQKKIVKWAFRVAGSSRMPARHLVGNAPASTDATEAMLVP
jgi:hypothetical protein